MNFKTLFISLTAISASQAGVLPVSSNHHHGACLCDRPDLYAPIGVMGDHLHARGHLMVSARSMFMSMEQSYLGSNTITDTQAQGLGYMIVPTDMDMQMHMLGMMYAPSDKLTFMAMINYVELSMNHSYGPGLANQFKTESSGWGDASLTALFGIWQDGHSGLHGGLGLLLPTADTKETGFIPPAGGVRRLPYPMQLGSGSWGIAPSLTYTGHFDDWSYGIQGSAKLLIDENDQGYRLGNRFEATSWIAKPLTGNFSTSLRATFSDWGDIHGTDAFIAGPVPTANPSLRAGSKFDLSAGLNFLTSSADLRAGLEIGKTLWQDLNGPQLGSDYWVTLGVQLSW
ncbi:MAG: transporter [Verrucomicrobiaceae bacterium]